MTRKNPPTELHRFGREYRARNDLPPCHEEGATHAWTIVLETYMADDSCERKYEQCGRCGRGRIVHLPVLDGSNPDGSTRYGEATTLYARPEKNGPA